MEIRTLQYFLAVVREESINRAAEVLHITQPTLSRQMAQLEEESGVKLFHRGSRKIELTENGILLKRRAEEILSLVDKTQDELALQDKLIDGKITIGCGEMFAVKVLSGIVSEFRSRYPLVTYDIFTASADLVKEQMEKGLIDIGVLLEPVDIERFEFIRLTQKERWVVLMPAGCGLAEKKCVSPKDMEGLPIILPRRLNVQNELSNWFGNSFKKLNVVFTSNLTINSAVMVSSGLAYAVVIENSIAFDEKQVVSRPLSPELNASSVFAWKKYQPFGAAAAKFIEFMKENYA